MADIVIDYDLLHRLAGQLRTLKSTLDGELKSYSTDTVLTSSGAVDIDVAGPATAGSALRWFYSVVYSPLKDSVDKLEDLAQTFELVATTWFDNDADFASSVAQQIFQGKVAVWEGQKKQYQTYLNLKNSYVDYVYYDENGVKQTKRVSLWNDEATPPVDPGAAPTSAGDSSTSYHTTATIDADGRTTSETTTVTSASGLTYTETTTYTYNGKNVDYSTTITHSDGTSETVAKTTNADGTYVVKDTTKDGTSTTTVTPTANDGYTSVTNGYDGSTSTETVVANTDGSATRTVVNDKGTDTYSRSTATGVWTKVSHEDPPVDDSTYYSGY